MRGIAGQLTVIAALLAAGCASAAPVPPGYTFPVWSVGQGGGSALGQGQGRLVSSGGCLYLELDTAEPRHLIVWPDTLRLALDAETVVVMDGERQVAPAGQRIRLGCGQISGDLIPANTGLWDRSHVWGANKVLPPD